MQSLYSPRPVNYFALFFPSSSPLSILFPLPPSSCRHILAAVVGAAVGAAVVVCRAESSSIVKAITPCALFDTFMLTHRTITGIHPQGHHLDDIASSCRYVP